MTDSGYDAFDDEFEEEELDGEGSEWEFYLCQIEDHPAAVLVDLSFQDEERTVPWQYLVRLRLHLLSPRDDGLCSSEEDDKLYSVDEAIVTAVDEADGALVYVGRVTCNGRRDFIFYAQDSAAAENLLSNVMSAFQDYDFEVASDFDPEWATYFQFLFPSPREMQMIMNERVLSSLAEHGDDPEIERDLTHWIYFPDVDQRSGFAARVSQGGYRVVEEGGDGSEESPFMLGIARRQTTDPGAVHDSVLELFDLAEEFEGEYDGWETSIERTDGQDADPDESQD